MCFAKTHACHSNGPLFFFLLCARLNYLFVFCPNRFTSCGTQRAGNGYGHNATATLTYDILTKIKLFRAYLASAEPIEVKFASATTNIQLGTAHIPIPVDLVNTLSTPRTGRSLQTLHDYSCTTQIINSRNKVIGDFRANFILTVLDQTTPRSATAPATKSMGGPRNDVASSATMRKMEIENDMKCENRSMTMRCPKCEKTKCNRLVSDGVGCGSTKVSSRMQIVSPLAEYLSGLPLTHNQENEALREMQSISPSESFIEALNADLKAVIATTPKIRPPSLESSQRSDTSNRVSSAEIAALQKIDSIRINVYDFILTNAGVRELCNGTVHGKSYANGTFIVEGKLDALLLMQCDEEVNGKHHTNSECFRMFSMSVDESASRIQFNRDAVRSIRVSATDRTAKKDGLSLIVWYRDAQMKRSQIIGAAHVPLRDVLKSNDFTLKKRCLVRTITGSIVLGLLTLKLELGCRSVHFGSEYIEAISLDPSDVECKGHHIQPSSFYHRKFIGSQHGICGDYCANCCKLCEHDAKIDDMILDACVYDAHDDHSNGKSTSPSVIDGQSNGTGDNRARLLRNGDGTNGKIDRDDEMFGLNNDGAPNHLDDPHCDLSLSGLFYVGLINFDRSRPRLGDTFLVCRPFWTSDGVIMTAKCGNNILNFLEVNDFSGRIDSLLLLL